jgi:hypothetical protein
LQHIESGEWDIDGNLAQHYFRRAVDGLPNLRHLIYGDYRTLALDGESYAELCKRLFGQTVCPTCSLTKDGAAVRFTDFVFYLQICGRDWDSLSVGRHPFEIPYNDRIVAPIALAGSDQGDVTMQWDALTHATRANEDRKLQIKSLRLPVMRTSLNVTKIMAGLSTFVDRGVIDLDLGVSTFSSLLAQPDDMMASYDTVAPLMGPLLIGFGSLRSLSLRGFSFEVSDMQEFLLGLAGTLRTFRLVNCHCPDTYDEFLASAEQSLAPTLALTGVEIYDLRFRNAIRAADSGVLRSEVRQFREMRASRAVWNVEVLAAKGRYMGQDIVSCWPFERQELEAAMLGGSVNTIALWFGAPSDVKRCRWWDNPATYR